ncbi:hypothetical protein ACHAXR_010620 [Thalassiosira sp. AJA248-18]
MMSSLSSISSKSSRSTSMSSSFLLPQHQTHASNSTATAAANKDSKKRLAGAVILALCLLNILDGDMFVRQSNTTGGRRSLLSSLYLAGPSTLLPWAQHHLMDVTERPDPEAETALFWHIPKSGGTTAKRLYQCMGQTLAHRVGADPKYGHSEESEVVVFEPHAGKDWKVVNVDTTIKAGINRAKEIGLVQSHTTDLIFTMEPNYAGQELYDEENKGRFLALFRHPVDRALSMFYYLQTATWERTYRPEWANMTVLEWANLPNSESDYMVHKLVGKTFGEKVDETDLIIAKELVRQRFIVGLMGEMNESIRRFNIVLGVDDESERSQNCMEEFGLVDEPVVEEEDETPVEVEEGEGEEEVARKLEEEKTRATDKKNSNAHPKFEPGSPEFEAVASRNFFDMLLYKYVEELFNAQKEIVDSYLLEEEPLEDVQDAPEEKSANPALLPPGSEVATVNNPLELRGNLANVVDPIQPDSETPFFWHIPKSGGTTLQRMYWCMGSTAANEVGGNPKFGIEQKGLVTFSPWKGNPGKVVNVDVSTHEGILDAKNRGFLSKEGQPKVDFISTSEFQFGSMMLFSPNHKARMFALFRHPIDRAVSKFFYLQKATWEPTYNERWAQMTLDEWASADRGDNNWMTRHLVGKSSKAELSIKDLETAKEIVRTKFVVGLMDKFEESAHRFNLLLGVDESDPKNQECINEFTKTKGDANAEKNQDTIVKKNEWNSYSHPEVDRGSPAWLSLAKIHVYDNHLYRYVAELFEEQRALFEQAVE